MAWLAGYNFRKKITVQVAFLDAVQTDFPLYVPINADAAIGGRCMANGYDLRFTSDDGTTVLNYERISFAVAAGLATGIFWVKTALATAPATDIYCYYGVAGAVDVSNPAATFSAYTRVWHLSEAYGTGAGNYKDALGVGNLTLTDADGDSGQGTGIVGKCVDLNGDADSLLDADHADHDPGGAFTIEACVNIDVLQSGGALLIHDLSSCKYALTLTSFHGGDSHLHARARTASGVFSTTSIAEVTAGNWFYGAVTFDKTLGANRLVLYVQGIQDRTVNGYAEDITAGDEGIIVGIYSSYLNGRIDEIRYSKDAKSASWIKFIYRNITEADNELTWAAEEVGIVDLVAAENTQAQIIDGATLVQIHILVPDEAWQLQIIDAAILTQIHNLLPDELRQLQMIDMAKLRIIYSVGRGEICDPSMKGIVQKINAIDGIINNPQTITGIVER